MSCCVERIDIFCQGRNFCIFLVSAMFCTAQAGPQVTSKLTWTEANTGRHSQSEGWKLSKLKLSFCLLIPRLIGHWHILDLLNGYQLVLADT